jgi:DNA-binding SARP family transcriptional activator
VRLLGRPEVVRLEAGGPGRDVEWRLRRALLLLAYLAAAPQHRAGKEELAEALWPEADRESLRRNFHPTLSWLRRALAPAGDRRRAAGVVARQGAYELDRGWRWEIDLLDFERLVAEGERALATAEAGAAIAAWEEAWRLYRGPFLEGFDAAWIEPVREEAHRRYLDLLRRLGDVYADLGRLEAAVDACRSLLGRDPLQEPVHLTLMRLYARQGRRDLVRRQYDRLQSTLSEELGVEPLLETTLEYHRLMGRAERPR